MNVCPEGGARVKGTASLQSAVHHMNVFKKTGCSVARWLPIHSNEGFTSHAFVKKGEVLHKGHVVLCFIISGDFSSAVCIGLWLISMAFILCSLTAAFVWWKWKHRSEDRRNVRAVVPMLDCDSSTLK